MSFIDSKSKPTTKLNVQFFTFKQIHDMIKKGELISDPIGQRSAVPGSYAKYAGIMGVFLAGFGTGIITIRDISNDAECQKLYPGAKYTVIDGGHRLRAIFKWIENKLRVNGATYDEQEDSSDLENNLQIAFDIKICTAQEACELFRMMGTATPVNRIEGLFANDESYTAKVIRMLIKSYKEYGYNTPHELFNHSYNTEQEKRPKYFASELDPRGKWKEWITILTVSLMKTHDVNIGWDDLVKLIENTPKDSKEMKKFNIVQKDVNKFLDDAVKFYNNRGKQIKLNGDDFDVFMSIWLGFFHYSKGNQFELKQPSFSRNFMTTYTRLTGTIDKSLNDEMLKNDDGSNYLIDDSPVMLKEWFKRAAKNHFASPDNRRLVFDTFMKYFDDSCVIYRDSKRTLNIREKEQALILQDYKCYIEGMPLMLIDAVPGHIIPYAHGGETKMTNIRMIHKKHNILMGTMNLLAYKKIYDEQGPEAAAYAARRFR